MASWWDAPEPCYCRGPNFIVAKTPDPTSIDFFMRHPRIEPIESVVLRRYRYAWGFSEASVYAEDEAQAHRVFADCITACWLVERIRRWVAA